MILKMTAKQLFFAILDITFFFSLCFAMLIFYKHVEPIKRGFFCNDEEIRKPYLESSIPASVAAAVGLSTNFVIIIITETIKYYQRKKDEDVFPKVLRKPIQFTCGTSVCDCPVILFKRIARVIYVFMFGAAVTAFLTDVMKYSVGRLRPHFLDICNPNWTSFNCTDRYGRPVLVTEYECLGTDEFKLKDARLSFPSGHASFGAYSMLMATLYVGYEVKSPEHSLFLKPVLQLLFLCLGLMTGLSRINDFKHHWSDVLVGFLLGMAIAVLTDRHLLKNEKETRDSQSYINGNAKTSEGNDSEQLFVQDGV